MAKRPAQKTSALCPPYRDRISESAINVGYSGSVFSGKPDFSLLLSMPFTGIFVFKDESDTNGARFISSRFENRIKNYAKLSYTLIFFLILFSSNLYDKRQSCIYDSSAIREIFDRSTMLANNFSRMPPSISPTVHVTWHNPDDGGRFPRKTPARLTSQVAPFVIFARSSDRE